MKIKKRNIKISRDILELMNKSICKLKNDKGETKTGFFC